MVEAISLRKIKMALLILSMKNAGHLKSPSLKKLQLKKMTISAPLPFKANIDGEPLAGRHFELQVVPGAIRVDFNREFIEQVRI